MPHLKEILTTYLQLINEFESDTLISSLKGIFETYAEEIGPYASDLIKSLIDLFFKLHEKEKNLDKMSNKTEDLMDAGFASQACLIGIEEILRAKVSQEMLVQIFHSLENVFLLCFSEEGLDFMAEASGILNIIIHKAKPITEKMWTLYPLLCYVLIGCDKNLTLLNTGMSQEAIDYNNRFLKIVGKEDFGSELLADISPIFKNYMFFGREEFLERSDAFGQKYSQILFNVISSTLNDEENQMDETYNLHAMMLIGSMISSFPAPQFNAYLRDCIIMSIKTLLKKNTPTMKNAFLHNICMALHNNTILTLEILNEQGVLQQFLGELLKGFTESATYRVRKAAF